MDQWDLFEGTEGSPPDASWRARMTPPARSTVAEATTPGMTAIVGTVFIVSDEQVAIVGHEEVRAHLAIAELVLRSKVSAPAEKLNQLRAFSTRLSAELARPALERRIRLSPLEGEMLDWLHNQFRIRQAHPVRMLYTCPTCGDQQVRNPDLRELRERAGNQNAAMKTVEDVASLALGSPTSAFVLVGNFLHLSAGSDPDYVCPSCEALDADSRPVTYCGSCKQRHDEPVLDTCRCGYRFSQAFERETFWRPAREALAEQQGAAQSRAARQPPLAARLRRFDPYLYDGAAGILRKLQGSAHPHSPPQARSASARPPGPSRAPAPPAAPPASATPPAPATVPRQVLRALPPKSPGDERPAPVTVRRRVPPPPGPDRGGSDGS